MTILFLILIVLACVALGFIILVQNPKGGGLSGTVAGINNQFMGVKQTNDVLEKGTWLFTGIIALLCIFSSFFMNTSANNSNMLDRVNPNTSTAPAKQAAPTPVQSTQPVQQTQPTQQTQPVEKQITEPAPTPGTTK